MDTVIRIHYSVFILLNLCTQYQVYVSVWQPKSSKLTNDGYLSLYVVGRVNIVRGMPIGIGFMGWYKLFLLANYLVSVFDVEYL